MKLNRIKKRVLITLFTALFASCFTAHNQNIHGKTIKNKIVLEDDKILIVTKVQLDLSPYEMFEISKYDKSNEYQLYVDLKYHQGLVTNYNDLKLAHSFPSYWDKYTIVEIPRSDFISIISLNHSGNNKDLISTKFNITTPIVIEINPEDKFIYLGEISFKQYNKNELGVWEPRIEINNNFEDIQYDFYNIVFDKNGKKVPITSSIIELKNNTSFNVVLTKRDR